VHNNNNSMLSKTPLKAKQIYVEYITHRSQSPLAYLFMTICKIW